MIKRITYIANDGTEFDNEFDCKEYEIGRSSDSLVLLDINYKPLDIADYEDAIYVIIRDEKAIKVLKKVCKEQGFFCSPWDYDGCKEEKCGIYVYNGEDDKFYNLEDRIKCLFEMRAECLNALKNDFGFESLYK